MLAVDEGISHCWNSPSCAFWNLPASIGAEEPNREVPLNFAALSLLRMESVAAPVDVGATPMRRFISSSIDEATCLVLGLLISIKGAGNEELSGSSLPASKGDGIPIAF